MDIIAVLKEVTKLQLPHMGDIIIFPKEKFEPLGLIINSDDYGVNIWWVDGFDDGIDNYWSYDDMKHFKMMKI